MMQNPSKWHVNNGNPAQYPHAGAGIANTDQTSDSREFDHLESDEQEKRLQVLPCKFARIATELQQFDQGAHTQQTRQRAEQTESDGQQDCLVCGPTGSFSLACTDKAGNEG